MPRAQVKPSVNELVRLGCGYIDRLLAQRPVYPCRCEFLRRPFQKLDAGDKERLQPAARGHFRRCETFAPAPFRPIGEIGERTAGGPQLLEVME